MALDQVLDEHSFDNRFAMDDKLYVVFTMQAVKNGFKSEQEGRPIFDDVPHIRIHVPGDKTSVTERPVTEEDKLRFASRWERFQKNMEQSPEGTPIDQWPQLTISQVHEFKAVGIVTVEQLAALSDINAQKFMGGNELRRRAQTFLAVAKDTAEAQRLAVANEELEARLKAQDAMLVKMSAQIEALQGKAQKAA
jgi:hypothetical protein